jgi:hypothetical protein
LVESASSSESLQLAMALFRSSRDAQESGNGPNWQKARRRQSLCNLRWLRFAAVATRKSRAIGQVGTGRIAVKVFAACHWVRFAETREIGRLFFCAFA